MQHALLTPRQRGSPETCSGTLGCCSFPVALVDAAAADAAATAAAAAAATTASLLSMPAPFKSAV